MTKKTRLKRKLDRLIQDKLVKENPNCLVCGEQTSEMHHYIQKSQSLKLRWDTRNLISLCKSCHCRWHRSGDPRIHQEILRKKGHAWADELERDRRKIFKNTLTNLREELEKWE